MHRVNIAFFESFNRPHSGPRTSHLRGLPYRRRIAEGFPGLIDDRLDTQERLQLTRVLPAHRQQYLLPGGTVVDKD